MKLLLITSCLYMYSVSVLSQNYTAFQANQHYGFKNNTGIQIEPEYQYAFDFTEGLALVQMNNLWGFIDENNDIIVPLIYDRCSEFSDGKATVIMDGKIGVLDNKGTTLVPPECDHIEILRNNYTIATKNGKQALFHHARQLTEFNFQKIERMWCGQFFYISGDKKGIMRMDGKVLTEPIFDDSPHGSREVSDKGDTSYYYYGKVNGNSSYSYFNEEGQILLDADKYDIKRVANRTFYAGLKGDQIKVVDLAKGTEILPWTKASIIDNIEWRPCDNFGYSDIDFLLFDINELVTMISKKDPTFRFEGLSSIPTFYEEFFVVKNENKTYDIYNNEAKKVASKVNVFERYNGEKICSFSESNLLVWNESGIAIWNDQGRAFEFSDDIDLNISTPLLNLNWNPEIPGRVHVLNADEKQVIIELIQGNEKELVMYFVHNKFRTWSLATIPADAKVKFKKVFYDDDVPYEVYFKINGKKVYYND